MPDEVSISYEEYIEDYLQIQTKDGQLIPLKKNTAQNRLFDIFAECYENDQPMKVIVLKARQLGISTVTEAIMSALCMTTYYVRGLIVAHNSDSSTHIFNMAKRYYDNLPRGLKPMIKYSNAKELHFENPDKNADREHKGLQSGIRVATAGQGGVARSQTYNYIHLSELAFWGEQDGQTVADQLTGILQTLPQHGFSMLVIESTANGYNYFKALWDQATNGESDYIPLFIPWFEMEEYRLPWNGEDFTEEEKELKDKFSLDEEQIMWRRYAIRNLCGNDPLKFRQEYPSTPEEAFILSGTPIFDTEKVLKRMTEVPDPIMKGNFSEEGSWYDSTMGATRIWETPLLGHVYVIGADTAGEGSDWFRAYVLDKTEGGRMVAAYGAQTDEGRFVKQLYWLGMMYNYAMIAPETNFSSYPTMKLQEYGYLNMYVRESVDTYLHRTQKKFGFRTTSLTRPLILDNLTDIVREHIHLINDPDLLKEMLSFVRNDRGRPEAAEGAHDDCVMASAIAFYVMPQAQESFYTDDFEEEPDDYSSFLSYGG